MKVRIKYKERIIADNILVADTMSARLVGLMFTNHPPDQCQGILLDPCNSIHTFFMKYSLDLAFMNSKNQIVKIVRDIKPWRLTWVYFRATKTLEMPAGKLPLDLREGEMLEVENV